MIEWTNLTGCFGEGTQNPSDDDLKKALSELFKSQDNEHPDAWIECGSENGPLYSVSIFSSGYALYTKYSDADMSDELENKKIENVTEDSAFALWKNLMDGNESKI
jgi:hypothetical protein